VLAVAVPAFPAGGYSPILSNPRDGFDYLFLPAVALALPVTAVLARYTQRSLRHVLDEDYIRTATVKGLRRSTVIIRHGLPNSLPAVLTVAGLQVGELLGGAVVVETVFAWPGLGQLAVSALNTRDYLLLQDLIVLGVAVFMVVQMLTDILHAALDPRIRLGAMQ
jgi:peptide/nickel transport system permease protein